MSISARSATAARVAVSVEARTASHTSAKSVQCYVTVVNASEVEMPGLLAGCSDASGDYLMAAASRRPFRPALGRGGLGRGW